MKLSCLPVSFFSEIINGRMSLREWAKMGSSLGLDAIDLSILFTPDHSPATLKRVRAEIESEGMQVAMVTSYPDFTHPSQAQRRRELEMEIEVVEVAAQLGAELVRVTAGQAHPETPREAGIAWAVEGLTRLQEATIACGVTLVYENHAKPGAWQYTDFSQPPDIFLEIVRQTSAVNLGVNFDTGNAAAFGDDPLDLLDQVIHRVISVHASDTARRGELIHVLLGTGVTPFYELFSRLKQAGWDGWICMEEASFTGREGVELAAKFIRQVWESVSVIEKSANV
jgi:sugar phosphate isomerase/epimerase